MIYILNQDHEEMNPYSLNQVHEVQLIFFFFALMRISFTGKEWVKTWMISIGTRCAVCKRR